MTPLDIAAREALNKAMDYLDRGGNLTIRNRRDLEDAVKEISSFATSQIQKAVEEEMEACIMASCSACREGRDVVPADDFGPGFEHPRVNGKFACWCAASSIRLRTQGGSR